MNPTSTRANPAPLTGLTNLTDLAGRLAGRSVAVIGGSRYFGRRLVAELRETGAAVTVVNRGSAPPPDGVAHLRADRDDEAALRAALGDRDFDVVVDQVCYTPRQAAVAARVFAGRTARYVLTSTVEVYAELGRRHGPALTEQAIDLDAQPVRPELPWQEPGFLDAHYGEGKRQAEAVLHAASGDGDFAFVSVRTAHVLGGGDFTGRLAHYTERIAARQPILVHPDPQPASFVHESEIARFLAWAAAADFTGPVNAASHGALNARELAATLDPAARVEIGTPASPFSFERAYPLDTGRAQDLGFHFSRTTDWLPGLHGASPRGGNLRDAGPHGGNLRERGALDAGPHHRGVLDAGPDGGSLLDAEPRGGSPRKQEVAA